MSGYDNTMTIADAQRDVREAHLCGATGMLVSGARWIASGVIALTVSPRAAMLALLAEANPFGALARERAFIIPLCLPLVFAVALARAEWFFPALMVVVGAHYLPFATLYGLRLNYVLGLALVAVG